MANSQILLLHKDFVMADAEFSIEFRDAVWLPDGRINVEINHIQYGWIPFTADENDVEPFGRAVFAYVAARIPPPSE